MPSIFQYWDTDVIPDSVAALCETFRERNPDLEHRVYSESQCEQLIGERFGARELAAFRACAVSSMQSDYFRYCVGLTFGGIYADADFKCLRSLRPLLEHPAADATLFFGRGALQLGTAHDGSQGPALWSGFFAFRRPNHPLLALSLEIATANIESRLAERIWPISGERMKWNAAVSILLSVGPGVFTLLWRTKDSGSFDALRRLLRGADLSRMADHYFEVIGDYDRVLEAFEGVRVAPLRELFTWVAHHELELPYKKTTQYWHNYYKLGTPIFR